MKEPESMIVGNIFFTVQMCSTRFDTLSCRFRYLTDDIFHSASDYDRYEHADNNDFSNSNKHMQCLNVPY